MVFGPCPFRDVVHASLAWPFARPGLHVVTLESDILSLDSRPVIKPETSASRSAWVNSYMHTTGSIDS